MLPTEELYSSLEIAYAHFNKALFENKLPPIIFTVQRQKGVMGYFIAERWGSRSGEKCHEIAINPAYLARSRLMEVLQTLVHEMTHCWQHCCGNPGRDYYHNKEWAKKMISIGLMPSSTGEPGGAITGQHMSDYIIEDGPFYKAYKQLFEKGKYNLAWVDRKALPRLHPSNIVTLANTIDTKDTEKVVQSPSVFESNIVETLPLAMYAPFSEQKLHSLTFADLMPQEIVEEQETERPKFVRIRYKCPGCHISVWGKPGIRIRCDDCNLPYKSER